jgi:branched-chain amino acid transport system ATP-binding protein
MLALNGVRKHFGALVVADRVNLVVERGTCHALIGPNGAGKTTLINLICGTLAADAGRIEFAGQDISRLPAHRRARLGLARTFQVSSLFTRLTVAENIMLACAARGEHPSNAEHARDDDAYYASAIEFAADCDLGERLGVVAGSLSHGEQRRLELAIALATRPGFLMLDEPMAGIGVAESASMTRLLADVRSRATILLIEHDMDTVFRLADRISVLVAGRIIATGTPQAIRDHADVRRAYLGDAGTEHR